MIRDDRALERAINFTATFLHLHNVLGNKPRINLADWTESNGRTYPLKRTAAWDAGIPRPEPTLFPASEGSPGDEQALRDWSRQARHSRMETFSFIRVSLWDRARWSGVVYLSESSHTQPPVLAPMFKNAEAAAAIFQAWHEELGHQDDDERLRVTIIRGIYKKYPHAYRVVFSANPPLPEARAEYGFAAVIMRSHTMEATSPLNLDRFLTNYRAVGAYFLMPAVVTNTEGEPQLLKSMGLLKRELHVLEAWQVGLHDLDSAGIREDDDPIIPSGVTGAPVLEVLHRERERP